MLTIFIKENMQKTRDSASVPKEVVVVFEEENRKLLVWHQTASVIVIIRLIMPCEHFHKVSVHLIALNLRSVLHI